MQLPTLLTSTQLIMDIQRSKLASLMFTNKPFQGASSRLFTNKRQSITKSFVPHSHCQNSNYPLPNETTRDLRVAKNIFVALIEAQSLQSMKSPYRKNTVPFFLSTSELLANCVAAVWCVVGN